MTSQTTPTGLNRKKIGPTTPQKPLPKPAGNYPTGGSRKDLPANGKRHGEIR